MLSSQYCSHVISSMLHAIIHDRGQVIVAKELFDIAMSGSNRRTAKLLLARMAKRDEANQSLNLSGSDLDQQEVK